MIPPCLYERWSSFASTANAWQTFFVSPILQLKREESFATERDKSKEKGRNDSERTKVFDRSPVSTAERLRTVLKWSSSLA